MNKVQYKCGCILQQDHELKHEAKSTEKSPNILTDLAHVSGTIGKDDHLEDPNVVQRIFKRSEAFIKVKSGHTSV